SDLIAMLGIAPSRFIAGDVVVSTFAEGRHTGPEDFRLRRVATFTNNLAVIGGELTGFGQGHGIRRTAPHGPADTIALPHEHPAFGSAWADRQIEPAAVTIAPGLGQSLHLQCGQSVVAHLSTMVIVHPVVHPMLRTIGGQEGIRKWLKA